MLQIVEIARTEVVDAQHLVTFCNERIRQVRTKEAGGSGDQNAHC